jgi:hypothetical protein
MLFKSFTHKNYTYSKFGPTPEDYEIYTFGKLHLVFNVAV